MQTWRNFLYSSVKLVKIQSFVFLVIIFVGTLLLATGSVANEEQVSGSVQFAADFYAAVREADPDGNIIISPLSLQTALGLLLMGADGTTAQQIIEGLKFKSGNKLAIAAYIQDSLVRYDQSGVLKVANKVYSAEGLNISPEFNEIAKNQFSSEAESIRFSDPNKAAEIINSWVENRTNHKIKDLFQPRLLDRHTRMVIANAVHFKAAWAEPFKEPRTFRTSFKVNETTRVRAYMMDSFLEIKTGNVPELEAKMALLPYADTDLNMLIILPNSITGLSQLEEKLKTYNFLEKANSLTKPWTKVRVRLPRFTIQTTVQLNPVLTQMGMGHMFTSAADFSKLFVESDQLSVGSAMHKAFIKVDEKGTEAAAATGFPIMRVTTTPLFICDHPFFFAIVGPHDVAFMGSVRSPSDVI